MSDDVPRKAAPKMGRRARKDPPSQPPPSGTAGGVPTPAGPPPSGPPPSGPPPGPPRAAVPRAPSGGGDSGPPSDGPPAPVCVPHPCPFALPVATHLLLRSQLGLSSCPLASLCVCPFLF
eukprot:TRINITY_DN331_c0_g1_i5.p1 TRINITY_DN331_c0_g1~~TRINITY_DN331_c0_g1_i5.p1  ORF type:complete len:120 (-),score=4.48 TRINITY_DN331_c0_g1_i5:109-468(-)